MSHNGETAYNLLVYRRVLDLTGASNADDLYKKLNIGRTTAFEWQRGGRPIPRKHLIRLGKQYGKPLEWFYQGAEHASENEEAPDGSTVRESSGSYQSPDPFDPFDQGDEEIRRILNIAYKVSQLSVERRIELERELDRELRPPVGPPEKPFQVSNAVQMPETDYKPGATTKIQGNPRRSTRRSATEEEIANAVEREQDKNKK